MTGVLAGHIVLVTGAAGTLGHAMCEAIEQAGGTAIRSDLAGRGTPGIPLDVTREADWQTAVAEIERTHGRLDGLVNNAGVATAGDVEETTYAEWRRVMAIGAPCLVLEDDALLGLPTPAFLMRVAPLAGIDHISLETRSRKKTVSRSLDPRAPMRRLWQDRTGSLGRLYPCGL